MRNIFIVNATQVVTSDSHPEGLYSVITGYPKTFDSRNYPSADSNPNGDNEKALNAAKSEYYSRLSSLYTGSENRVMSTITLTTSQGRIVLSENLGAFPDMSGDEK